MARAWMRLAEGKRVRQLDSPEHLLGATSATTVPPASDRAGGRPADRAFRDSQRQLQDARAITDAGLADQLADWSRALLLHA